MRSVNKEKGEKSIRKTSRDFPVSDDVTIEVE